MTGRVWVAAVLVAALGAATFGGVLYGFSAFIMPGLDEAPPETAIVAMSEFNRAAPRAPLMLLMVGTAVVLLAIVVGAFRDLARGSTRAWLLVAGAGSYFSSFLITMVFHVPRNDRLMNADVADGQAGSTWNDFVGPWVAMNHVRTATAILGALLLTLWLLRRPGATS